MKGKVKLVCGEQSECFSFSVAQSLLYIRKEMNRVSIIKKPGWELPEDSPYEFKDNGLIKRTNTGNSKKSAKSDGDTTRDKAPKTP